MAPEPLTACSGRSRLAARRRVVDGAEVIWLDVAMKRVKIAELKDQLSRHLREVENGGEVEVTDRDRPIARIVPVTNARSSLVLIPPRRPFSAVRGTRHAPARWALSSTELLLEETAAETAGSAGEEAAYLREIMARLPEREQNLLLLRYWIGLSHQEVAQALDLPEGTVRRQSAELIAKLRERWSEDETRNTV